MDASQLYGELCGALGPKDSGPTPKGDRVVYSDLRHGSALSEGGGFSLKYVARGRVDHQVGRRTFRVRAGEFICVPEGLRSELEVRRQDEPSMIGLCLFLAAPAGGVAAGESLEEPIVFPARCSRLGRLLAHEAAEFRMSGLRREDRAPRLLQRVGEGLEELLEEAAHGLESLGAAKASTRYDGLRRLNLARGYLHEVVDRAVALDELARVAGVSRFQLLRDFRNCFGAPPGSYHRHVRLGLAKAEIERGRLTCGQAAERFGFADSSSFSHAYRRAFGTAPTRAVRGG